MPVSRAALSPCVNPSTRRRTEPSALACSIAREREAGEREALMRACTHWCLSVSRKLLPSPLQGPSPAFFRAASDGGLQSALSVPFSLSHTHTPSLSLSPLAKMKPSQSSPAPDYKKRETNELFGATPAGEEDGVAAVAASPAPPLRLGGGAVRLCCRRLLPRDLVSDAAPRRRRRRRRRPERPRFRRRGRRGGQSLWRRRRPRVRRRRSHLGRPDLWPREHARLKREG